MTINDSLAQALSHINNSEAVSKQVVEIKPVSKMLKNVLDIMKDKMYVGSYEIVPVSGGDKLVLNLLGNVNKCGVIKPRFAFKYEDSEKVEQKYLPAKGFGIVIVSTSQGLMTLEESKANKIGGKLVAYCY